jgi:cbb3-type cytochrome oxidase subunit 1
LGAGFFTLFQNRSGFSARDKFMANFVGGGCFLLGALIMAWAVFRLNEAITLCPWLHSH